MFEGAEPLYGWIDESGDPSANPRSTRWFIVALVLETGRPGALAEAMAEIKHSTSPVIGAPQVPHFRTLPPRAKSAAHELLAAVDFTLIAAIVDTRAISERNPLRDPKAMYAHALSAVIDRGASRAGLEGRSLEIAVEDSPNLDLGRLRKPAPAGERGGAPPRFNADEFPASTVSVRPAPKNSDLRLGAADGVANALFGALEHGGTGRGSAGVHADIYVPKLRAGTGDAGIGAIVLPSKHASRAIVSHPWLAKLFAI